MTNKPFVSGALAQVHGECVEGCLDSSWTLDHPTVNHNHCLWRCWPPRRIQLTMDLETHICRSISLKAIYRLNETNLHFSNVVASLRKRLCEPTIVPHGNKSGSFSPRAYESMAIPFRFLKFWQSADLSKPLGHPNRLAVPLSSRSFPRSWECGFYLSRSGGKMEGYHPAAVLMTFEYAYIMHTFSIDWHWEMYCGHMDISIHGATETSSFLPWKTTMACQNIWHDFWSTPSWEDPKIIREGRSVGWPETMIVP